MFYRSEEVAFVCQHVEAQISTQQENAFTERRPGVVHARRQPTASAQPAPPAGWQQNHRSVANFRSNGGITSHGLTQGENVFSGDAESQLTMEVS